MIEILGAVGSIILIDLVLSGDNALVIGAAAAGLPRRQRWYAIALGGSGAIVLRITFAVIATLLLRLPLLQAIGGLLLLMIAIRLLMDRSDAKHTKSVERASSPQEGKFGLATDALPTRDDELEKLARSLGYGRLSRSRFLEHYRRVTRRARRVTDRLFYGEE